MQQDTDPRLTSALRETAEELRREFDEKLQRQRQELQSLILGEPVVEAAEPAEAEPAEKVAAEVSPALEPLEELKHAASEIDRAQSQAEILEALMRSASRFASRAAIFLSREGGLQGWGGSGFGAQDSAVKDLALEYEPGSAWERITSGEGGLALTAEDCASLCNQLEVEPPETGLLLPFVLGDQVAAVLYFDRAHSEDPFQISALQLLSFLAGQTLETLPVRSRPSTGTLRLAVTEVIAPVEEAEEGAPIEFVEAPEAPAPIEFVEAPEAPAPIELVEEPEAPTPVEAAAPPEAIPEELLERAGEEPIVETAAEGLWPEAEPPTVAEEFPAVETEPPPIESEPVEAPSYPPEVPGEFPTPETVAPIPEPLAEPSAMEPAEAAAEPVVETAAEAEISPDVALAPPDTAEPSPPPSFPVEPAEAPSLPTTQVTPPGDVEGPGWAFTTTRIPSAAGNEALHEEARRLARLLVTEIKLYNEETVEEGRRANDVYSRLKEDIERSRQIYEDRIDAEVREQKDYFREALVRILAGGDPAALGI